MAVWRTKAYDLFGFKAGEYSYARGKVELFADLVEMAMQAGREDDADLLDRITEYVRWAAAQNADGLQSALDLAFFLPIFRHRELHDLFRGRIPDELLSEKRRLLSDDSSDTETVP